MDAWRKLRLRARSDAGFGMIELVCAMGVMSVGVMAVYAMFQAGAVQVRRASTVTTAAALADAEVERFRAVKFETIGLASSDMGSAATDVTYVNASGGAYKPVSSPVNQTDSTVIVTKCPASPCTSALPIKTANGADGRNYRVDTYITWGSVANANGVAGRNVKLLTVVVRDASTLRTYARVASSFDAATGQ